MKNLSPINENKDVVTKEYVDSKVAFYDGRVHRSTNTDTTNCWVKIAECEAPNSTAQIMDEITLYPNTTDSAVKTTCKVRVEGKGAYASTWKLHIIDSTKDFNSNKVKLIYDKNIVDDKRKIELWGYNINGWDGFYSQKTFGNNYTLTYGLKCLTSQNKFATTYLHDDFVEAPTIDISIKSLVNEGLTSLENDIALNRTTLGTQCKNLLDETGYLSSITSVTRGTKSISGNQITLTATADNCFTNPHTSSDGGYRIPVEPDTDYILSWESDNTYAGLVYVFMNGNTSNYKNANNKVSKYIKFTTNSDTTFITIRLAVATSGNSITYSNIMLRYADILDDTYEPYQPSLIDRCLLKDTAGINLGHAQSDSITIDNLSAYTALWVNVSGGVSGINFTTNLIVPVAYLAKSTSNSVQLAGGIPSSAYITSEGVLAAKYMDGTITAKISGNTLELTIGKGTIGAIEVISLM